MFTKLLCVFILIFQGVGYMRFENLIDSFGHYQSLIVTINNEQVELEKGDDKAEKIIQTLVKITEHSHEMPAFGVSIDNLTREDMKQGLWVELRFDNVCRYEGMDFEGLLINVGNNDFGFNLIRMNNGIYDGRCFYLSLSQSTKELYNLINDMSLRANLN